MFKGNNQELKTVSLREFNIKRPERLNYDFPLFAPDRVIDQIKSKSLRSFLADTDDMLKKNNITWKYEDLTKKKYNEWLPFYKEKMEEHNYDVRAKAGWYQEKIKQGFILKCIFFYKNEKMVGSGIFSLKNNKANFAYKASDRITIGSKTSSSLGSIIEFLFLKLAAQNHCDIANSRSRNAFGFFNTLGYLDYKLRFGYTITPVLDALLLNDVPINEKGVSLFFGLQDDEFILFSLQPETMRGKELYDKKRFLASGLVLKEIYY